MGDFFNSFFQSLHERVRSPILGSVFFSLLLWNWRVVLIVFSGGTAQFKITAIEMQYNFFSSILWPIFIGVGLALTFPVLVFAGAWAARWPKFWLHCLEQDEATKREINGYRVEAERLDAQTDFKRARADREAQDENEILERARRDREAEDLGQEAVDELAAARTRKFTGREGDDFESIVKILVVKALGIMDARCKLKEISEFVQSNLKSTDRAKIGRGHRFEVIFSHALEELVSEGSVLRFKGSLGDPDEFGLSGDGYGFFDNIKNS